MLPAKLLNETAKSACSITSYPLVGGIYGKNLATPSSAHPIVSLAGGENPIAPRLYSFWMAYPCGSCHGCCREPRRRDLPCINPWQPHQNCPAKRTSLPKHWGSAVVVNFKTTVAEARVSCNRQILNASICHGRSARVW